MAVAEEVQSIYPEGEAAIARLAEDPAHLFFKGYGAQVPKADWNDPGTKQGIYMIGPGGEYLEGAHAVSGNPGRFVARMETALKRWKALKRENNYAAKPIPRAASVAPPAVDAAPMALRVSVRDLPRGKGDRSGRRRTKTDLRETSWNGFTEWAWNQDWFTIEDPLALVPTGDEAQPIDESLVLRLAREALIDTARGQNPHWQAEEVLSASLTMRATETTEQTMLIEYAGAANMQAGEKTYAPKLAGRAVWDLEAGTFRSLQLVAVGERAGAARYNLRKGDREAAPMGVLLELHQKAQ